MKLVRLTTAAFSKRSSQVSPLWQVAATAIPEDLAMFTVGDMVRWCDDSRHWFQGEVLDVIGGVLHVDTGHRVLRVVAADRCRLVG